MAIVPDGDGVEAPVDAGGDETADPSAETVTAAAGSGGSAARTLPRRAVKVVSASDDGRYELGDELARGGGGRVCKAFDRKLGRDVAIKFPHDDEEGVALRLRLEREARILARLEHPAIVPIHDTGTWKDGTPYFAMRLLGGRTLKDAMRAATTFEARLELLPVVKAIAEAMAYAHRQGVIHRDLKPTNVLVGELGDTVVIDWGLARLRSDPADVEAEATPRSVAAVAARAAATTTLTATGAVAGTPAYMAPEQARGDELDARVDVYAIGVILYELLAGIRPHSGLDHRDLAERIVAGPPTPLEEREPRVRRELAAIVEKAMARDVAHRYRDAGELAEDLDRYQSGRRVAAHRYSRAALAGRWLRRRAFLLSAIVAVGALVGVATLVLTRASAPSREADCRRAAAAATQAHWNPQRLARLQAAFQGSAVPRDQADSILARVRVRLDGQVAAIGAMRIDACVAHARGAQTGAALDRRMTCLDRRLGQIDAAVAVLSAADAAVVRAAPDLLGRLGDVEACADLDRLTAVAPLPDDPAVRRAIAALSDRLEQVTFAMDSGKVIDMAPLEAVVAEARTLMYGPLTALALQRVSAEHAGRGDFAAAEREVRESIVLAEASGDDRTRLGSMNGMLSLTSRDHGRDAETLEWMRQASALAQRISADEDLAALWARKGEFQAARGQFVEAIASGQQGLEVLAAMPRPPASHVGLVNYQLAYAYLNTQRHEDAFAALDRAEAAYAAAYGAENTHLSNLLNLRGGALAMLGRYDEALPLYRRAVAIEQRVAPDGPTLAINLLSLGDLLAMLPHEREGLAVLERGRKLTADLHGTEHPQYVTYLRTIGKVHGYLQEYDQALTNLREALVISDRVLGESSPETATAVVELGDVLRTARRYEEAIVEYRQAVARMDRNPQRHPARGQALTGYGDALVQAGRWREAIVVLEEAMPLAEAEREPQTIATTKYALARALVGAGRDRPRALALAKEARALLVSAQVSTAAAGVAEIDAWLASH